MLKRYLIPNECESTETFPLAKRYLVSVSNIHSVWLVYVNVAPAILKGVATFGFE